MMMVEWTTHKLLPDLLIQVRQFTRSSRWWQVTIWNGDMASQKAQLLITGKNKTDAIKRAAKAYKDGDF